MKTFDEWKRELYTDFGFSPNFADVATVGMYTFYPDSIILGQAFSGDSYSSIFEIEREIVWLEDMAGALKSYLEWRKENEAEEGK
jgi:hypothetical protein